MTNYTELSLAELRAILRANNVAGYSSMRKADMIALLESMKLTDSAEPAKAEEKRADNADSENAAEDVPRKAKERAPKKSAENAPKKTAENTRRKSASAKAEETAVKPAEASSPAASVDAAEARRQPQQTAQDTGVKQAQPTQETGAQQAQSAQETGAQQPQSGRTGVVVRRTTRTVGRPENRPNDGRGDEENRQIRSNGEDRRPVRNGGETRPAAGSESGEDRAVRQGDPTDSGIIRRGIFEICSDNYGFLRNDNYLPSEHDVYINPSMIRRYNLTTGDVVEGTLKRVTPGSGEKFVPLHHITKINDKEPEYAMRRRRFDRLTPVFPHERLRLEYPGCGVSTRIVDLFSPIGKGQRGMIVSQPKAGKTTLLKQIAKSILVNHKSVHLIILLIDERPEEVTDFKDFVKDYNAEVIYSTFDEEPNQHRRVSEMTMERAKRLVEYGEDVVILLDSITRLARAYNLTCVSSGRTLSGGLDPNALYMPKKFFGAARCMKEGGSLTILATALVETGSRMDDVIFEEFKGTGNMELVLNRDLSERRIFPAIDLPKSSTRREDLLLTEQEQRANNIMRKAFSGKSAEESIEKIINLLVRTKNNQEFMQFIMR
ncbi:MAG: transcription termination factor Rho [Lachnospiraceae bacterium]|nr:transcription termination factor Rho [Lachnospiraceae bacterium]